MLFLTCQPHPRESATIGVMVPFGDAAAFAAPPPAAPRARCAADPPAPAGACCPAAAPPCCACGHAAATKLPVMTNARNAPARLMVCPPRPVCEHAPPPL